MTRARIVGVAVALVAAACSGGDISVSDPTTTAQAGAVPEIPVEVEVESTTIPTTTTAPVVERLPSLAADIDGAIRTSEGLALAITGTDGESWFLVGACEAQTAVSATTATQIRPQHVVLDPGSPAGDAATGAHNLAVAQRTAELLELDGVAVALTRESASDLSSVARAAFAPAVGAALMVSIQHLTESGGETTDAPRPAVFHQIDDRESQRLAGLVHEELVAGLASLGGLWTALPEPGARPLLNQRGQDYFVVLQRKGTPAVRVEIAALDENGTTLLANEEGRETEARALADAIVRFLVTDEEGNGFIEPAETVRIAPTTNSPGGCS